MKITEEQKAKIEAEFKEWESQQYAGKSKEERQKMAQFFTPPVLSIKMLEKFDSVQDKDILDPACGAGGLLVAAIIAGADPKKIYGIELDPKIAEICRIRLSKLGVPRHHIHVGNALEESSYDFNPSKNVYSLSYDKSKKKMHVSFSERSGKVKLDKILDMASKNNVECFYKLCKKFIEKEFECVEGEDLINAFNRLFLKLGYKAV